MSRLTAAFVALTLIGMLSSFGCGADGTGPSTAGIRVLAGGDAADTALARLDQALIIQVVGPNGRPDSGLTVRFEPAPAPGAQPYSLGAYVAPIDGTSFGGLMIDTTDAKGRAAALVILGVAAGPTQIKVSVPELSLTTTVAYAVLPGAPFQIRAAPEDTTVAVGGAMRLRATVLDQYGNSRGDPVEYTAGTPDLAVTSDGAVEGRTVARSYVVARAGAWTDTTMVSVVPNGTLAAVRSSDGKLVLVNLDGTNLRTLAAVSGLESGAPSWSPGGDRLVYATEAGSWDVMKLYSVDLNGTVQPLLPGEVAGLESTTWPHFSRDGAWVYFSGRPLTTNFALWRVHSDGSGAEQIGAEGYAAGGLDWRPSPSPDGSRLAYVTAGSSGAEIRVFDIATRTSSTWRVPGQTPRWSPTRELIAFVVQYGGALKLMNADGTNIRTIAAGRNYAEGMFSWSPDGVWLAVRGTETIELLNVDTGLVLPLGFARDLLTPAWRP